MNAIIALCHFCETHGPSVVFCTQTLRDLRVEHLRLDQHSISSKTCSACTSLGPRNGMFSKDGESGGTFLSAQNSPLPELAALVKQASVRSLSCEINGNKDGGFVFFGDTTRGHVLSHTFHVSDLQARGFYQLFSIIILMKDKYFLLNTKPFLADHLRRISKEVQNYARKVKDNKESIRSSRQHQMTSSQMITHTPRSLVELTNEENIFHILHSHFSWLLLTGSRFLTEHVTFGNLPWLPPQSSGRPPQERLTYTHITLPMIEKYEDSFDDPEQEELFSLRHAKQILENNLEEVCYCALTGVKIVVRGAPERTFNFMLSLTKLLPEQMHKLVRIDAQHQHSISSEYKIISVAHDIAVPIASESVLRIDFLDDGSKEVSVKWPGHLPSKLPQLLNKLIKTVDEPRFSDLVVNKQTKVLIEEWKNKVVCLNCAKPSNSILKLTKVLGVQPQDQSLINYWGAHIR